MGKNKAKTLELGFSLLEMMVVLIVASIMLAGCVSLYKQFMSVHRQEQRVMLIERSLLDTKASLQQTLTSLPGKGLGVSNGESFINPILPAAGTLPDSIGRPIPIRLGIITPYKVNGQDAFMLVYADGTIPRLPIKSIIPATSTGQAIVAAPDPLTVSSNPTATGLPWIPTPEMFHTDDLMLVTGAAEFYDTTVSELPSQLVKLISVAKAGITTHQLPPPRNPNIVRVPSPPNPDDLVFTYDPCTSGECGSKLPGLSNNPYLPVSTAFGAVLVPLKITSFYLKSGRIGSQLIRNDGGVILPDGSGGFSVRSGVETVVGETDTFTVTYRLKDGTTQPTPNSPIVPWLKDVASVDINLSGSMKGINGSEVLSRQALVSFSLIKRNLE